MERASDMAGKEEIREGDIEKDKLHEKLHICRNGIYTIMMCAKCTHVGFDLCYELYFGCCFFFLVSFLVF